MRSKNENAGAICEMRWCRREQNENVRNDVRNDGAYSYLRKNRKCTDLPPTNENEVIGMPCRASWCRQYLRA